MNRKNLWMLPLLGMMLLALPALGQSGYAYEVGDDGEAKVWVQAETGGGEPVHKEHVRIVVVDDEDGEPKTYEWKTGDGKVINLSGEGNVHFIEDMMRRGYLGVQLVELTPELRQHYGATAENGVLVGKVEPGSPAEAAGLRVGDVIVALDGESMEGSWDIRRHVRALEDGETLAIEAIRDGTRLDLSATIVEKERPEVDIRRFVGRSEDNPFVYHVDPEGWKDVVVGLEKKLSSPEFQTRIQSFGSREKELEEKLEALEKKIEELTRRLDEKE